MLKAGKLRRRAQHTQERERKYPTVSRSPVVGFAPQLVSPSTRREKLYVACSPIWQGMLRYAHLDGGRINL